MATNHSLYKELKWKELWHYTIFIATNGILGRGAKDEPYQEWYFWHTNQRSKGTLAAVFSGHWSTSYACKCNMILVPAL